VSITKDQAMKIAYDAGLTTLGAAGVGFVSKKALKIELGLPKTGEGIAKMVGAVAIGSALVSYMKQKKWIPSEIDT